MEELTLSRNKWLEQNRIVKDRAVPKRTKQISSPNFTGTVPLFSIDATRTVKNREEEAAIWFYCRLNPYRKDWYFQQKAARRGFKKAIRYGDERCYPLSFAAMSAHFRGTGQTIALTFKKVSHWFRIDLDNHGCRNTPKIIKEFSVLYQLLLDNETELKERGIKWFVEFRPDLSGIHFDFWCERQQSVTGGRRFFTDILKSIGIEAEVYPANSCCKLFGCTQYLQVLDKIYRLPNLTVLFDFLNDPEFYEHASLRWIADELNFDWYESGDYLPISEPKSSMERIASTEEVCFKNRAWQNIVDYFSGSQIFPLNKICCVVSRIAIFQNKTEEEIVASLTRNLDKIPESSRESSYFSLTRNEREKRIRELVTNAVQLKYLDDRELSEAKLRKTANRFTSTGRDVLEPLGSCQVILPSINIVGANPDLTALPEEYITQINDSLSKLLPKKQRGNALKIAFSLTELCFLQSNRGKPISKSYFDEHFRREFDWKPRKGSELYRLLDALVDLGLIKRTKIERNTMYWGLGDKVSEYLGIEVNYENYSEPIRITPEMLEGEWI